MGTLKQTMIAVIDASVSSSARKADLKSCTELYDHILKLAAEELNSISEGKQELMLPRVMAAANVLQNVTTTDFSKLPDLLGQYRKQVEAFRKV